jgi:phosphoribulokinase
VLSSNELDVVILDGLHSLYKEVTGNFVKVKIFLDNDNSDKQKLDRDIAKRNQSEEAILDSIRKREDDYDNYIATQGDLSNFKIKVTGQRFEITISDDFDLKLLLDYGGHIEHMHLIDNEVSIFGDYKNLMNTIETIMNIFKNHRYL